MAIEAGVETEEEGAAVPARKGIPKRLLIIAAAGLAVLLVAAGSLYFFVFAGRPIEAVRTAPAHTFIFNLPPMTVNLKSIDGSADQYMKLMIALEVADESVMQSIQPLMAKVIDAFQVYLRELRKSDLEGSAGIYRLKEELRRRVNVAIFPDQIEGILFKEILVQ